MIPAIFNRTIIEHQGTTFSLIGANLTAQITEPD